MIPVPLVFSSLSLCFLVCFLESSVAVLDSARRLDRILPNACNKAAKHWAHFRARFGVWGLGRLAIGDVTTKVWSRLNTGVVTDGPSHTAGAASAPAPAFQCQWATTRVRLGVGWWPNKQQWQNLRTIADSR